MKSIFKILTAFAVAMLIGGTLLAQVPQKFNYQAALRDGSGNIIASSIVGIQISIRDGSSTGTIIYQETHSPTTSAQGLVSIMIGGGSSTMGTFSTIDWSSGMKFIEVGLDPSGGSSYTSLGVTQLIAVPYALMAKDVMNKDDADADPANEIQTLSISGSDITISGGNTITLPPPPAGDDWGTQVVQTDATLGGDGTTGNQLGLAQNGATYGQALKWSGTAWTPMADQVNDADFSTTNELQSLSISSNTLTISNGNSVTLPASPWSSSSTNIYRPSGYVGIGTTPELGYKLYVLTNSFSDSAAIAGLGYYDARGYLGVQGRNNFGSLATVDISGYEIGVLGVSMGLSSGDNYGVYGHSNGYGGHFEHSTSGNEVSLGGSTYALKIVDGNQGDGKVLVSDASGNAEWGSSTMKVALPVTQYYIESSGYTVGQSYMGYVYLTPSTTGSKYFHIYGAVPTEVNGVQKKLKSVTVVYDLSNATSYISATRVRTQTPTSSSTLINDNTDRTSTTRASYTYTDSTPANVQGTIGVEFYCTFGGTGTSHNIYIYSVILEFE